MSLSNKFFISSFFAVVLNSCIGTDLIEDSVSKVEIAATREFLNVDESLQMSSFALNEFGDQFGISVMWKSSNTSVATIDVNGLVFGVSKGQTLITANFEGTASRGFQLNVIDIVNQVAYLKVTGPGMRIEAGESIDLNAFAYRSDDTTIEGLEISWSSSDEGIATVDAEGLVKGLADGTADIVATTDGVNSEPFRIIVGGEFGVRTGTFVGKGGYNVSGEVRVSILDVNAIQVSIQENFSSNNGPGLYVYLSNLENSVQGGRELAPLASTSGPSAYPADGVGIDDYKYVIILCKPFNVVFGLAELN